MKLIEKKIKKEDFLKTLSGALSKSPSRIKKELGYKHNRFNTKMNYVEAVNTIENKNYSIKDLFLDEIEEGKTEK